MKTTPSCKGRCLPQHGQAMVEGVIVLMVLLTLWFAVSWLGTLQHMALQVSHGSRYMAFAATRAFDHQALEQMRSAYFMGPGHQWWDRTGRRLQSPEPEQIRVVSSRGTNLIPEAQPGGKASTVSKLRMELGTADSGILKQAVILDLYRTGTTGMAVPASPWPGNPSAIWPVLQRQTSILTGAGHAIDDRAVQQRLGGAHVAWANSAQASYGLTTRIDGAMGAVDAGWRRNRPVADWLQAWAGHVPEHHFLP